MITGSEVNTYIEDLIAPRTEILAQLEKEAKEENIPIIQLPSAKFLHTLLSAVQPRHILEIGTAIGYSTIWLAHASPKARITTMEIDQERIRRAQQNFQTAGVQERIQIIEGDAGIGLSGDYRFDCLFIDAAKGQYQAYLDLYLPLLEEGGLVICDNVLFKGMVAAEAVENKRLAPMVRKLKAFNEALMTHPLLETAIIPIGDGLSLSVKRKGL